MTSPKRLRLIAAHPIDKPRKPTKVLKLKQRRLIEEWCKKQRKDNTE